MPGYIIKGGYIACGCGGGGPPFLFFLPRPVKVPDFMGGGTPLTAALGGPCPFIIERGTPIRLPEEECFLGGGGAPFNIEPLPMYIMPGGALESRASRLFERFFFFLSFLWAWPPPVRSSSFSSGMGGGGGDEGMSICRGRFR